MNCYRQFGVVSVDRARDRSLHAYSNFSGRVPDFFGIQAEGANLNGNIRGRLFMPKCQPNQPYWRNTNVRNEKKRW